MPRTLVLLTLATVLFTGTAARAEPLWSYNWLTDTAVLKTQTGGLTLAATPAGQADGPGTVKVAELGLFNSQRATTPEELHDAPYTFRVDLTDTASTQTTTLTFHGQIDGTFSASGVQLTNTFLDGVKEATLGNWVYSVSLSEFKAPDPLDAGVPGFILASVAIRPKDTRPVSTPEPSSLVLAGLTLPAVAALLRRRG